MTKASRVVKKTVHSYCIGFGIREPYQIILDGEFCKAALGKQIYIKDELPNIMAGKTRIAVTDCILHDIKEKGHDFTSAYILAKKFETRKCPHKENPVSAYQCIRDLVGSENKQHFCVATQNPKLRDRMRKVPGVPILYVNVKHQTLGLEPMTAKSKKVMEIHEMEKVKPLDKETARLKRSLYASEDEEKAVEKPQPKKRKVKGVNPLAMKKKKKQTPPPPKKKDNKKDSKPDNKPKEAASSK